MNNLIDYYTDNLTSIYGRVKRLLDIINQVFMPEDLSIPDLTVKPPLSKMFNRHTYLWTIDNMRHLQQVIDFLVGTYNQYNVVDVTTSNETDYIKLWMPESLVINDEYQQRLAQDFDTVNKLLDKLMKYAEPYNKKG